MHSHASTWFACVDVHARHAVFPGNAFLRCATKTIEALFQADFIKADLVEKCDELCLRQSAGDSTRPQIDIPSDRFGQLVRNDDVAVQELAARLQNPEHLAKRFSLVRRQV